MGIPGSVISKTLYMNKPSHTTFLDFSNYQWIAGEPIHHLIVQFSGYDITPIDMLPTSWIHCRNSNIEKLMFSL